MATFSLFYKYSKTKTGLYKISDLTEIYFTPNNYTILVIIIKDIVITPLIQFIKLLNIHF